MRFYTYRNFAKIVLAVFVFNICFVFTGNAHDPCANERSAEAAKQAVLDSAEYTRDQIEESGYMTAIVTGTIIGALGGAAGGASFGGGGAIPGAIGVGIIGGASGAYYHYEELEKANEKVRWAAEEHAKAKHNLEKCEANNSNFSYHCPYCDTHWKFDNHIDLMNFSHNHQ